VKSPPDPLTPEQVLALDPASAATSLDLLLAFAQQQARLISGEVQDLRETGAYRDGLHGAAPTLAEDLRGISAYALVVPFARGRLRAAASRLESLEQDHLAEIRAALKRRSEGEHQAALGVIRARLRRAAEQQQSLDLNPFEVLYLRDELNLEASEAASEKTASEAARVATADVVGGEQSPPTTSP